MADNARRPPWVALGIGVSVAAIIALTLTFVWSIGAALLVDRIPGADAGLATTSELRTLQALVPVGFIAFVVLVALAIVFFALRLVRDVGEVSTSSTH